MFEQNTRPTLPDHLPQELTALLEFALEQGHYAEQLRNNNAMQQAHKRDGSLVTQADHAISEAAIKQLPGIVDVPVVSEEQQTRHEHYPRFWLIDPIDGTASYTGYYDGYAIAIALIENGRPQLSIVMAPARQLAYVAASGMGSYRIDCSSNSIKRLQQPHQGEPRFASFYKRSIAHDRALAAFLKRHGMTMQQVLPESSLLKYCLVAEGRYAYAGGWSSLDSWDIAAADLVVHEAGGRMVDAMTGLPFYYRANDSRVHAPLAVGKGVAFD